ncbi:D-arabinono-1,4-lactone oxidase [Streptomyces sp. SID3212]|uniref:D-arabinono-1,4-lactone oxidase n=1 Tax=Streptomyces sp. SID3212 TaxID=2690259 RepID=UPI00136EC2D9|nr:D-arabinono-1,4-lactone oxidase [Streptomyces sp. SID3212]MYV53472.1 FAD-binding protein [Streptomyces sp. SID3212]
MTQLEATTDLPRTNWAGNVSYDPGRVHRPRTLDELRRLVAERTRIRALGSGHSFSAVAEAPGDRVLLDGLPRTVRLDRQEATVTVAAGTRYADLAFGLQRAGLALANLASLPHISVAGSCATGTHGSGDGQRCLASSVAGLRLVGPEGDLVELRRDTDRDTFAGSVVALGALGVVTEVTLDVEPTYDMTQRVRVRAPLTEVAERFDDVFSAAYSVSVFTDWLGDGTQVWLKDRLDRGGNGKNGGWAGGEPARVPLNPVPGMPPEFSTEQLGTAGPWFERLPHFRPELTPGAGEEFQSEYYLPREAAPAAFAALRGIGHLLAPALHIAEVRTVRADDLWLSPAYGRDSVTFHFTWIKDAAAITPLIDAVEELLVPLGARPHWGKLTSLGASEIAAGYERAVEFGRLARKYDPEGKFSNGFLDALFPEG